MRVFLLSLSILFSTLGFAQHSLTIEFAGLESREGKVMLALRDADGNDLRKVIVDIPASGVVSHTFTNVEKGTYTAAAFHDENEDKEINTNAVGYPTEAYGFSNDARGTFGPPDLEDQRFEVKGDKKIVITLQ
ncbi:DUF2141 domain-containing protein [Phaeocystidibacter luteus]|uniref:DUF2141 domain-containing protein n=1 Tax=Phaeocystidibacter luteus TaxID=911197 RepID=A0A6N6RKN3_9FLAO|nr:DUF2141 domain-containing protein [Phaeocystidibacter luteus]KAB2813630.1 DUF2141 domain-containing protein [Phaeocystidibacter luteus]